MADPTGMVCTSGEYKGRRIEVCVDQAEYTNERRNQAAVRFAEKTQIVSIDGDKKEIATLGEGRNLDELWAKFAKTPAGRVAGYVFKPLSDKVFPKSRAGFDGTNHPLVDVPGKAITLDDGRTMLGAQELCGFETVEINGKMYRKRLLTPDEWTAVASKFGKQDHSTRSGKLDKGVHYDDADGARAVGQAKGYYVEHGGKEVYDMNGNVYEWTYDPATQKFFVSGGSWSCYISWYLQADYRGEDRPDNRDDVVGLRCGVSPQDSPIESK